MKVVASLVRPVEAETPYGGRVVSYEPVGSLWLSLGARRRRERTEGGVTRGVETLSATVRADPRLADCELVRLSRLSVAEIKPEEWEIICEMGGL